MTSPLVITGADLQRAAQSILREHLGWGLAALEKRLHLSLPAPKTWERLADFTRIPEEKSPAVVVTSPGILGVPELGTDGVVTAVWGVRVVTVVRGRSYSETCDRTAGYVAGIRGTLLDHRDLAGLASDAWWVAETLSELDVAESRTIGAGSVTIAYRVPTAESFSWDPATQATSGPDTGTDAAPDSPGTASVVQPSVHPALD